MTDYHKMMLDIFGTDNELILRDIAQKAAQYTLKNPGVNLHKRAGRKSAVSYPIMNEMIELQKKGDSIQRLAKYFGLSRQTIYKYLEPQKRWEQNPDITMRIYFMNFDQVCSMIDIDFIHKQVYVVNFAKEWISRAFGAIEAPSWNDFEYLLESRCFPKTRDGAKQLLQELGLDCYDPLRIVEKTQGRIDGDYKWLKFEYKMR